MTLSQKRVLEMIQQSESFSQGDMGFILTVLRDNCTDDELHRYLDILVHELWERRE